MSPTRSKPLPGVIPEHVTFSVDLNDNAKKVAVWGSIVVVTVALASLVKAFLKK